MTITTWDQSLPRRGDRVGGKYLVHAELGRGATAVVFEVEDLVVGRRAAMKVVRTASEAHFERFRREARTAAAIRHPNVVRLYDVGQLEAGWPYLLMELIRGQTLEEHLESGALRVPEVRDLGVQVLAALAAVHAGGSVHRDIKPGNLVLEPNATGFVVKLIDFGICRPARNPQNPQITAHGIAVGTMEYMSPEQVCGVPLDRRADLYACGVVLYEALTGRSPFSEVAHPDLMNAIVEGRFAPPSRWEPECPPELEQLLLRAMRRVPSDRWSHAEEMAAALRAVG